MKLLVCGGRDYQDREAAFSALDRVDRKRKVMLVIHGGATGADALADEWAQARGVSRLPFPVTPEEWHKLGLVAGPMRNERMIRVGGPDGVVALPGGSGTADLVRRVRAANVQVWMPYGGVNE
jgi:predicted Rossmann-fold nucleotide-binding protein